MRFIKLSSLLTSTRIVCSTAVAGALLSSPPAFGAAFGAAGFGVAGAAGAVGAAFCAAGAAAGATAGFGASALISPGA